ncbi:MAG: Uma2 family endonuclease [Microcystis aeruginosa G13-03]|nr:Uma2 family endonuclease [Microcystis aeruginosa G13-03]
MSLSLITRKFTVEEYEKMATQGIIKPDEKVELIRGEIIKMSPMGTRHAAGIARLTQLLYQKFGDLILLGVQNPIRLNNNSQPEPDLSLLIPRSYQAIQKYYRGESIFIESFPEIELTLIEILGNIC